MTTKTAVSRSIATPSAKAHERVTGRWNRDIKIETSRQWAFHYVKIAVGTPVPWLMLLFLMSVFVSRPALEVSAWATAFCTLIYIVADRFSETREFKFFLLGSDAPIWLYVFTCALGVVLFLPFDDALIGLGALRWVILAYALAYALEVFPGLNRLYLFLVGAAGASAAYGAWQHFAGFDPVYGGNLQYAPIKEHAYFCARGLFETPEAFGTLLAMVLPLPVCGYLFIDRRDSLPLRWGLLALSLLFMCAILWTYRPGLWIAGGAGVLITVVLQLRRQLTLLAAAAALLITIGFVAYDSPAHFIDGIQHSQGERVTAQRAEINRQLTMFKQNIWLGAGLENKETHAFSRENGNIYFQILAESGVVGLLTYLAFALGFLLHTYHLWQEIPVTHFWHRTMAAGILCGQVALHVAGLYWPSLRDPHISYLFAFFVASVAYTTERYNRGLVPDDYSL